MNTLPKKKGHRFIGDLRIMYKIIVIVLAIIATLGGIEIVQAERLSVKTDIANIRSEPNTSATVIWQVEKYHPIEVVQKQGDWYLFKDFEGDRGWIHNSVLSKVKTVIVEKDNCNVRSGPGSNDDIRFTVDKGVPFKVLEEKEDWLHVIHSDNDQGWIHRSLVW